MPRLFAAHEASSHHWQEFNDLGRGTYVDLLLKSSLWLILALIAGKMQPGVDLEVWEGAEGAVKGSIIGMPSSGCIRNHQDVSGIIRIPVPNPLGSGVLFCKPFLCIFCSIYCPGKRCLFKSLAMLFLPRLKALSFLLQAPPPSLPQPPQSTGAAQGCFRK